MIIENTDDEIDWQIIDEKKALFILSEAKCALSDCQKNNTFLQIKIYILIVMFAFYFAATLLSYRILHCNKYFTFSALVFPFFSFILIVLKSLTGKIPISGSDPYELSKQKYNENDLKSLVIAKLMSYGDAIKDIKHINKKTGGAINDSILIFVIFFSIFFVHLLLHLIFLTHE